MQENNLKVVFEIFFEFETIRSHGSRGFKEPEELKKKKKTIPSTLCSNFWKPEKCVKNRKAWNKPDRKAKYLHRYKDNYFSLETES